MTKDQIIELALKLPSQDQHEVIQRLLEAAEEVGSLDELDAAWADEIQRRMDQVRSGEAKTKPWTEVMDNLEKRAHERSQPPST